MKFPLLIFTVFSGVFFTRGVTSNPFLQGHLVFTLITTTSIFFHLILYPKLNKTVFFLVIIALCNTSLVLTQFYILDFSLNLINELGRVSIPILSTAAFIFVHQNIKHPRILEQMFIVVVLFLFTVDMMFRLSDMTSFNTRYSAKSGGFLFVDSNFTGFFLASLVLLLSHYKTLFRKHQYYTIIVITIMVLISTGSLAAYAMVLFGLTLRAFVRNRGAYLIIALSTVLLLIFAADMLTALFNDGSLHTKVEVITKAILSIRSSNMIELFLGHGSGNFTKFTGSRYPSHNLFGLFAEVGLTFVVLQGLIYFSLCLKLSSSICSLLVATIFVGCVSLYPLAYMSLQWVMIYVAVIAINRCEMRNYSRQTGALAGGI